MKVSLNTIRQFIDFDLPPVGELVERINQQLGQVEEVIDLADKYKDVVIVKVLQAEKHPNADRLSVCVIDDGGTVHDIERDSDGYIQVVCGAANVRAGLFAAWLPPKSTVPASYEDEQPFVLDVRELRGVKSNGMLAAADELALGNDHGGIIEINPDEILPSGVTIQPGTSFSKAYGLDDTIIDIENKMFTHRPDCFGQLGVAREIAGILGQKFTSPEWYLNQPTFESADDLELSISNDAVEKCPRFMAVALKDVAVQPSPLWLQIELVRLGGKPINTIVDATNYVMLLTAQPTHAYDYDKLRGATLGVRMAKNGEKTELLNGKSYDLSEDDIVIVDGEGIVGLGGVMGGSNSEVSETTKNIVLEVATFDMYAVRKTSMRHGIFTDAVTRFNKGQSPLQNDRILAYLLQLIGGMQASDVVDTKQHFDAERRGAVDFITGDFINARLGSSLSDEELAGLLRNVEIDIDDNLHIHAIPFWRTDLELPEDIVEEVGRLRGFDTLPRELPRRSIAPATKNPTHVMKQYVRQALRAAGANEALTYSFVHANVLQRAGQGVEQAYRLGNALSPDLQYYRLSIVPSLLSYVHANIKTGHDNFALFEFGKAHRKGDFDDDGLPREYNRLGFVYTSKKSKTSAYYSAKRYAERIAPGLRYQPLSLFDASHYPVIEQMVAPFNPERSAVLMNDDAFVGVVGEFTANVTRTFKLPAATAGFEIFQSYLRDVSAAGYIPLSKYPSLTQDISLKVTTVVAYDALVNIVRAELEIVTDKGLTVQVVPLSIYQAEHNTTHKTVTLRLIATSDTSTLSDKDISPILERIAVVAHETFGAERI